jgi:hypothetical protein
MCVCGPKLKNTSRTVKDSSDKVNRVHGHASNAAEVNEVRHHRQARVGARMSPKQRLAVRQIDSAPLLSDLRNWFVGDVIAAEGVREGVLADSGFAIAVNGCSRPG